MNDKTIMVKAPHTEADWIPEMSLRDYFAAQAMPAFIHEVYADNIADHGMDSIVRKAYQMADAMIEGRKL